MRETGTNGELKKETQYAGESWQDPCREPLRGTESKSKLQAHTLLTKLRTF